MKVKLPFLAQTYIEKITLRNFSSPILETGISLHGAYKTLYKWLQTLTFDLVSRRDLCVPIL